MESSDEDNDERDDKDSDLNEQYFTFHYYYKSRSIWRSVKWPGNVLGQNIFMIIVQELGTPWHSLHYSAQQ